ncbi:MAG TPA: hypothetical protein PKY59_20915 [Pyrinomonadaceae bacterium]|nr:hypothetical protein [Pyrinomonadaceae bacterium]
MNIKSLRKNYDQLSRRERLILYDSAENRDDESEMDAILLATPNERWIKPDFSYEAEQLLKIRLIMLAQRLKHCRETMYWFALAESQALSNRKKADDNFFFDYASLQAYFYCVSVDSALAIYKEIGLDLEAWKAKENEIFDFDFVDEQTDKLMRSIAFTEAEAEAFINEVGKQHGYKKVTLGFTLEKETKSLREILKKQGFAEYLKD